MSAVIVKRFPSCVQCDLCMYLVCVCVCVCVCVSIAGKLCVDYRKWCVVYAYMEWVNLCLIYMAVPQPRVNWIHTNQ